MRVFMCEQEGVKIKKQRQKKKKQKLKKQINCARESVCIYICGRE